MGVVAKVAAEVGSTANRYQILAKLAVGGMAEIFLARGASVAGVERYCVLKRILREHASDAQFVRMFLDEARLAAQLQHPNIASVYDVGMLGDSYFFTMEYVHGETIRSLLQRAHGLRRPIPLACILTIIAGAATGLHHAHERNANDGRPLGIVHRDVSPSNLMVSYEGHVKVVDFGVAKADDRAVKTRSGTVKGKISYLSPEQCRGTRVDRRSDLFSLGIVMWEMLTGTRLYRRASDFDNMTAIVNELPPPPSSHRPEIPHVVDEIVLRLLEKSAADRFQTAAEVLEAIEDASVRAGTILSTSAVIRMVRDLFGVRAEPWLELEGDTLLHEPVTLLSRHVPGDFKVGPLDPVEAELASVPELNSSSMEIETHEVSILSELAPAPQHVGSIPAPLMPSAPIGTAAPIVRWSQVIPAAPAAPASAPIEVAAAPSAPVKAESSAMRPSQTAIPVAVPSPPSVPSAVRAASPSLLAIPAAPSAPVAAPEAPSAPAAAAATARAGSAAAVPTPLRPSESAIPIASQSSGSDPIAIPAVARPANAKAWGNSTLLGVSAPSSSSAGTYAAVLATRSRLLAQIAPPASATDASTADASTEVTASTSEPTGSQPVHPQSHPAITTSSLAMTQVRDRNRRASRVSWPLIAVTVVAAAIGVGLVWFSMLPNDREPDGSSAAPGGAPSPDVAAGMFNASNVQGPAQVAEVGPHVRGPSAIDDGELVNPDPPAGTAPEPPIVPIDAALPPATTAPLHRRPPPYGGVRRSPPANAPPVDPMPAPPAPGPSPDGNNQPALESLSRLFHNGDYVTVVSNCSAALMRFEIASVCTMAACQEHDPALARLWLPAGDPAKHDALVTYCKEHGGIDIGKTLDCSKDALDCQ